MSTRPSLSVAHLGRGERLAPLVASIFSFARWYWRTLRQMAVFAAGYTVGGIVVAVLIECPPILRALAGS